MTNHTSRQNEAERLALKRRLEREHGWRVDALKNRFGWYARFFKPGKRGKQKGQTGH